MPLADLRTAFGQLVVPGEKEVPKHSPEIEINKVRTVAEEKVFMREHFLERQERIFEASQPIGLLRAPLIHAAAAELAFLVTERMHLFGFRNKFLPVNVVQAERRAFDLVLNETPKNRLNAFQFGGEQSEIEFRIEILRDHL